MKFLIIIVSLLVFAETQFALGREAKNESNVIKVDESIQHLDADEPESLDLKDSKHEANRSIQNNGIQMSPDILVSGKKSNGNKKLLTTPDGAKQNKGGAPTSVDEMRNRANANLDNAIKKAKLLFEKVQADYETLINNAGIEREAALKKVDEKFKKEDSIVAVIAKRGMKKFTEAEKQAEKEYQQTMSVAEENYFKAEKETKAAVEAAEEEFEQARAQILENKRKLENEHQPELEKARKQKEIAEAVAKSNLNKAQEKYKKVRRGRPMRKLSAGERKKIESEYEEEVDKYNEALKLADDEWQSVLDKIGIGKQYKEAEDQALDKLEKAREKAELMMQKLWDEDEKVFKEARMKKDETMKQAEADKLKAEDECKNIYDEAAKQKQITSHRIEAKYRKILTQANEVLKKASAEFIKAKNEAKNEYNKALQTIKEMEKKLTTEANSPGKIVNQQLSTPGRSNSRILENVQSSQGQSMDGDEEDDK